MLLGDSSGSKYESFVVFKAPRSTIQEQHEENLRLRHGFGRTLWRQIEPLESGLQIHGNAKGAFMDEFEKINCCKSDNYIVALIVFDVIRLVERLPLDPVSSFSLRKPSRASDANSPALGRLFGPLDP